MSTHWSFKPSPERPTTLELLRPRLMPDGDISQQSSAPLQKPSSMSTWMTSFQLSREDPGRGAKCSGTSSTKSNGCSA